MKNKNDAKCQILAFYLPQFHEIPENNKWWGKGYTEWDAVKSAQPLSKYSVQPRIPYRNNYYDLSKVESLSKQAEIAKKYSVDGFCIYHYYSNGQLLLETPAENLLNHPDINIRYCFSWANHDWKRTWYTYNQEMLRKQEYGNEKQIVEHYNYLRPFFLDSRYIKHQNKPVFVIYRREDIPNFDQYMEIWNRLAREDGFSGLYYIRTIGGLASSLEKEDCDAAVDFEPGITIKMSNSLQEKLRRKIRQAYNKAFPGKQIVENVYDYKKYTEIIAAKSYKDKAHLYGVFTSWDNTPRHKYHGIVFKNATVENFATLLKKQYIKSIETNRPFLFINAWNEWSEGAYLEPDTVTEFGYLEAISEVVREFE